MIVKLVRLITGDDLLCELIDGGHGDREFSVAVKNPVRIVVMPDKNDPRNPKIGLAPWMEFSKSNEFVFKRDHVLIVTDPIPEFRQQYEGMFGAILTPQRGLLVPDNSIGEGTQQRKSSGIILP